MIQLQALELNNADAALHYAEMARGYRDTSNDPTVKTRTFGPNEIKSIKEWATGTRTVIAYSVFEKSTFAFVFRNGVSTMTPLLIGRKELEAAASSLHRSVRGEASSIRENRHATHLHDALIAPLEIHGETTLAIIPDRALNRLPFAALVDRTSSSYLVETHTITIVPSLMWLADALENQSRRGPVAGRVLIVADPALEPSTQNDLKPLIHARAVAPSIASLYVNPVLLTREDATRSRILEAIPRREILNVEAHVTIDGHNPRISRIETSLASQEGALSVDDLLNANLEHLRIAALFGCDSASTFDHGERQAVAGLARVFLHQGVGSVLASLWAIDDEATAELSLAFHTELANGATTTEALRIAQLSMIQEARSRNDGTWAAIQHYGLPTKRGSNHAL